MGPDGVPMANYGSALKGTQEEAVGLRVCSFET